MYIVEVTTTAGMVGYVSSTKGGDFILDSDMMNAAVTNDSAIADMIAESVNKKHGRSLKTVKVKKFKGARASNPVPPSSVVRKKQAAADLYQDFSGHPAEYCDTVDVEWPDVGLTVGKCSGILYDTVRDGVSEKYIHRFKKSAQPLLVASHDGKSLALIGGSFNFTNRGIVDN